MCIRDRERRKNFNYIQADYDIFCRSDDEDEDVELQRKKYSEGVWVEDNCEEHFVFEYLYKLLVFSYGRNFEHEQQNIERPLERFSSLRGFSSTDAARVLILIRSSVEMFLGVTHKNFQAIHMYSLTPFVHLDFGLSGTDSERRRIMGFLWGFVVRFI